MARWDRASDETLIATGSRSGLCQWEDDDPEGRSMGRMCYRRTSDVYCGVHNRQLERESARERRKREAAEQMVDTRPPAPEPASQNAPPKPKAPRTRARRRARELESRWGQYKLDHPERARLYKSSAWTAARDRQLRDHPMCVVCGAKASVADHILNRARGGADLDPRNLQSMCRRCHHAKTVEESHCGRGAAERRKR